MSKLTRNILLSIFGVFFSLSLVFGTGFVKSYAAEELSFSGAYITLSDGIAAKFVFTVPDGYTSAVAKFTFEGNETEKTFEVSGGKNIISFDGMNPAQIDKPVALSLTLTGDGKESLTGDASFTVSDYLGNLLTAEPSGFREIKTQSQYVAMRTLVANLVNYSAKAKLFLGEEDTVSAVLSNETVKSYVGTAVPSTDDKKIGEIPADSDYGFIGAKLSLGEKVNVVLLFVARENDIDVEVTLGNSTVTLDSFPDSTVSVSKEGYKAYRAVYRGLSSTDLNKKIVARLKTAEGDYVGNAVEYSVGSYVCSMQKSTDEVTKALAAAVYNYGLAAENYAEKMSESLGERLEAGEYDSQTATSLKKNGWTGEAGGYAYNAITDGTYLYVYTPQGLARFYPEKSKTTSDGQEYELAGIVNGAIGEDSGVISQSVAMFIHSGNIYVYGRTEQKWYYRPLDKLLETEWQETSLPVNLGEYASKVANVYAFEETGKVAVLTTDKEIVILDENGNKESAYSVETSGKNRLGGGKNGYLYYAFNANDTKNPKVIVINTVTGKQTEITLENCGYQSSSAVTSIFEYNGTLAYTMLSWKSGAQSHFQKVEFNSVPHKESTELSG